MVTNTEKIASNTIYQLLGKGISMSVTVLATWIIAKTYGRQEFGIFSLMQTWPAFFFIITDFGINAVAVRELSKDWSKSSRYFSNILIIRVIMAILLIVFLAVVLKFFPYTPGLLYGIRLSLFLILTQSLYTTTNIIFQAKLRYDYSTIGYISGYAFILISIILLTFFR